MKLIMTLLVRDEADIVDINLRYHLERGVDFVIATDNGSEDGTLEILEQHAREGHLHLIREPSQTYEQGKWVTRMARLAAVEFDADWVVHGDADEFFWPEDSSLKGPLEEVPEQYGALAVPRFNFIPRPEESGFFADRMTISMVRSTDTVGNLVKPKIAHRALPEAQVRNGCHRVEGGGLIPMGGWYPIETLHFPLRSYAQWENKISMGARAKQSVDPERWQAKLSGQTGARPKNTTLLHGYRLLEQGRLREEYARFVYGDAEVEAGLRRGHLVVDTRLQRFLSSRDAEREMEQTDGARGRYRASESRSAGEPGPGDDPDPTTAREVALLKAAAGHEQHVLELTSGVRKSLRKELAQEVRRRRDVTRRLKQATRRFAKASRRLDAIEGSRWWRLGALLRSPLRAAGALWRPRGR